MKLTITGENVSLRDKAWQKLIADFVAEHGDLAVERLDGEEASFESMQEAMQTLPFLAARQLVVIRNGSANKSFTESIERLLNDLPDTTDLLLVESKLDKRLVYYKTLKKQTDFKDFAALDERGLARWLVDTANAQGGKLSQTDALFLVERVGSDQQLLANELDKLLLYDNSVSRQTIEALTDSAPQSTIFDLIEAAFAGRIEKAMDLYEEQRAQKVEPQQIIAMIGWQVHVLAVMVSGADKTPDQIASQAKINPYVVRRTAALAKKLPISRVRQMVGDLASLDYRLKHAPINADEALKNYILHLA